jgi:hypothetical protein
MVGYYEDAEESASSILARGLFLFGSSFRGTKLATDTIMNAKPFLVTALGVAVLAGAALSPTRSSGQPASDDEALTALLNDVATQQATLADNQTKIDAKLATVAENVRLARIFVSRGGSKAP